mmetsp:Transcript_24410/g.27149  ORF Transcript_24410/g.27149 Transcript_24410/m.27149 type:complete len:195 (+) Transcript_24410:175-759(+)
MNNQLFIEKVMKESNNKPDNKCNSRITWDISSSCIQSRLPIKPSDRPFGSLQTPEQQSSAAVEEMEYYFAWLVWLDDLHRTRPNDYKRFFLQEEEIKQKLKTMFTAFISSETSVLQDGSIVTEKQPSTFIPCNKLRGRVQKTYDRKSLHIPAVKLREVRICSSQYGFIFWMLVSQILHLFRHCSPCFIYLTRYI